MATAVTGNERIVIGMPGSAGFFMLRPSLTLCHEGSGVSTFAPAGRNAADN